jgi:hypothetical protein
VLDVLFSRALGFFCSLPFLIKKGINKFELYFFPSVFGHQNPGARLDPDSLEMLDPDSMNPDPQLCCEV